MSKKSCGAVYGRAVQPTGRTHGNRDVQSDPLEAQAWIQPTLTVGAGYDKLYVLRYVLVNKSFFLLLHVYVIINNVILYYL